MLASNVARRVRAAAAARVAPAARTAHWGAAPWRVSASAVATSRRALAGSAGAPPTADAPAGGAEVDPLEEWPTPVDVTFGDVGQAAFRIRDGVARTTVRESRKISALLGSQIFLKKEFDLPTGSFKERGARNALLKLEGSAREKGVIAASAGNHAQALAYHGAMLKIPVTVVMPAVAPLTKIQNCRDMGATVIVEGEHLGESRLYAMNYSKQKGLKYINGYDHPDVIAGAGTMGMEIVEQVPDVDAVIVPIGGAGLIAGTALAIKTLRPNALVIGVEPASVPSFTEALNKGRPTMVSPGHTLADGLLVPKVGTNAFHVARKYVDKTVVVKERFIALAMLRLIEMEKCVVEGGGAVGLAAMLQGLLPELKGKKVVLPLCGGNVDTVTLGRVIERGLAADGRLVRFVANVSDRPGGIANLTKALADHGVSIRDIYHERAWVDSDISMVAVKIVAETMGFEHTEEMYRILAAKGYELEILGPRPVASLSPAAAVRKGV